MINKEAYHNLHVFKYYFEVILVLLLLKMDIPLSPQMIDDDDDEIDVVKIEIKDGLYIGDSFTAIDLDFIKRNKISRVINCCGD